MIRKIYCDDERLHFKELEINQRLNILVGGNGVGKTTLLNGIHENCYKMDTNKSIEIIKYSNSRDNIRVKTGLNMTTPQLVACANAKSMSEGQSIMYSIVSFFAKLKEEALELDNKNKSLVVVLDEVDSGLSVDAINVVMHFICDMLKNYKNTQFFVSSNNYHFTYIQKDVINMYTGRYKKINSYEEYFELMISGMQTVGKKSDYSFLDETKWWNGM